MNKCIKDENKKYDLVVFRCEFCASELRTEEYNPYVYKTGETVPVDRIEIIQVPVQFCENSENNLNNNLMQSIPLCCCSEKPWLVAIYENKEFREKGEPIYFLYNSFHEALYEAENMCRINNFEGFEIRINYQEEGNEIEEIAVYSAFQSEDGVNWFLV